MKPFLKWPGGKQWLLHKIKYPIIFNTYYEPFLGSGAVFFELKPQKAVLSDLNMELINLFNVMKSNPNELIEKLKNHNEQHNEKYYYIIRDGVYENSIDRAARFLYLNRTCYNGMYRENRAGKFNVPIGTKNDCIYDIGLFAEYCKNLKHAEILSGDFEQFIAKAQRNDFVFCDPPYRISSNQSQFIKYNGSLFSWNDQLRLFNAICNAKGRGVHILMTNANCNEIEMLYQKQGFYIKKIQKYSSIAGKTTGRGKVEELVISSYDC